MKNLLHKLSWNHRFDNSVITRNQTRSRIAKVPKLEPFYIRTIRSNWQNMERLAMVTAVVGSFFLGFPVATAHAATQPMGSPQINVEIGAPLVEPVCSYGYYESPPYACAPLGFYGPEYFFQGHFRGVGPWDGKAMGYDKAHGEKNFHQINQRAGRSPETGSHGASDIKKGENNGNHDR
jgi:hypothetical protein